MVLDRTRLQECCARLGSSSPAGSCCSKLVRRVRTSFPVLPAAARSSTGAFTSYTHPQYGLFGCQPFKGCVLPPLLLPARERSRRIPDAIVEHRRALRLDLSIQNLATPCAVQSELSAMTSRATKPAATAPEDVAAITSEQGHSRHCIHGHLLPCWLHVRLQLSTGEIFHPSHVCVTTATVSFVKMLS